MEFYRNPDLLARRPESVTTGRMSYVERSANPVPGEMSAYLNDEPVLEAVEQSIGPDEMHEARSFDNSIDGNFLREQIKDVIEDKIEDGIEEIFEKGDVIFARPTNLFEEDDHNSATIF